MAGDKTIYIIAGSNGAGKTTFARDFLLGEIHCSIFLNADLIAAGLSPFAPERAVLQAGRLMLEQIQIQISKGNSFAFETTLSGKVYARLIPQWQALGYAIHLVYLTLPNVEMAIDRVAARVKQGGHAIPEETIRRRFAAGLINFHQFYKPLVDKWFLYDNATEKSVLLEEGGQS